MKKLLLFIGLVFGLALSAKALTCVSNIVFEVNVPNCTTNIAYSVTVTGPAGCVSNIVPGVAWAILCFNCCTSCDDSDCITVTIDLIGDQCCNALGFMKMGRITYERGGDFFHDDLIMARSRRRITAQLRCNDICFSTGNFYWGVCNPENCNVPPCEPPCP